VPEEIEMLSLHGARCFVKIMFSGGRAEFRSEGAFDWR
jgi:hypothetical protein